MNKIPVLESYHIESICQNIANTNDVLTGTEIAKLLQDCKITDTDPSITKWKRLYNAFVNWQNQHHCSNNILNFLKYALQPVKYLGKEEIFQYRRHEINKRLSFIGIEINDKGNLAKTDKAETISEAEQRASKYKYKLLSRNTHSEVIKYCNSELLQENYFHSVFEAVKSIADRIRFMTGVNADGNALTDTAFSTNNPLIKINLLRTDTDRNEHIGLMNLIKGMFSYIRNTTAHTPKIKFVIEEDEALDVMTVVSLIHKRLDKAL